MAKDIFHNNVRAALLKDGWKITSDPLRINISKTAYMEVDLAAESVFTAEREGEKIAVEIKSFVAKSFISAFHEAMGQYLDYKSALADTDPERIVFLAVPTNAFNHELFQGQFIQKRIREEEAKLIVFNPQDNTIVQWIK
ncbi:MAG: element excision factor XisH family protein [Saprospiraceae bacterium]